MTNRIPFLAALLVAAALLPQWASAFDPDEFEKAYFSGKLPTPDSLDEFKAQVAWMREHGAKTSEISEHMSKVIDQRLDASNKLRGGESIFNPFKTGAVNARKERWKAFDRALDPELNLPGKGLDAGLRYEHAAKAAWEYQVGNCNASACLAYYILKESGIDSRLLTSTAGGGHEFVVIGLGPNADVNDPSTWGENARVVDGWFGRSLTADEAKDNRYHFAGETTNPNGSPRVIDTTRVYDDQKVHKAWEAMGEKGYLTVFVKGPDGNGVGGVTVTLSSQEGQSAATNGSGMARFMCYPGAVTATASVAADSGLEGASASAQVETKRNVEITLTLGGRTDLGKIREVIQEAKNHETAAVAHLAEAKEQLLIVKEECAKCDALRESAGDLAKSFRGVDSSTGLVTPPDKIPSKGEVQKLVASLQSTASAADAHAKEIGDWAHQAPSSPEKTLKDWKTQAQANTDMDSRAFDVSADAARAMDGIIQEIREAVRQTDEAAAGTGLIVQATPGLKEAVSRATSALRAWDTMRLQAVEERDRMKASKEEAKRLLGAATSNSEKDLLGEIEAIGEDLPTGEFEQDLRWAGEVSKAADLLQRFINTGTKAANYLSSEETQARLAWAQGVLASEGVEVDALTHVVEDARHAIEREKAALAQLLGGTDEELVQVPGVRTLKASEARFDLQAAGFKVDLQPSKDKAPNPEDEGTVASQSPAKGEWKSKGSVVTVFVYRAGDAGGAANPAPSLAGHWNGRYTIIEDKLAPANCGPQSAHDFELIIQEDFVSGKLVAWFHNRVQPTWRLGEKTVEITPEQDHLQWKGTLTASDDGTSLVGTVETHYTVGDGRDEFLRYKIELSKGR